MQSGAPDGTAMGMRVSNDRLTVSLGEGQKSKLEALADANGVPLAFVVRYALDEFLERRREHQLQLKLLDTEDRV